MNDNIEKLIRISRKIVEERRAEFIDITTLTDPNFDRSNLI